MRITATIPVVLQHGAGEDGETWAEVVRALRRPCHVHEAPAHGGRFGAPLERLEDLADDLVAHTPDASDPYGSVLVGHALGGAVALQAALDHPEGVAGVVTVCTGVSWPADQRLQRALLEGDLDAAISIVRPAVRGSNGQPETTHARSAERIARLWRRTGLRALAADYRAVDVSGLVERLQPLEVPVRVLGGAADRLVPPHEVERLATRLGVEPRLVPGASHQVPWEAPEEVAAAIEEVRRAAEERLG